MHEIVLICSVGMLISAERRAHFSSNTKLLPVLCDFLSNHTVLNRWSFLYFSCVFHMHINEIIPKEGQRQKPTPCACMWEGREKTAHIRFSHGFSLLCYQNQAKIIRRTSAAHLRIFFKIAAGRRKREVIKITHNRMWKKMAKKRDRWAKRFLRDARLQRMKMYPDFPLCFVLLKLNSSTIIAYIAISFSTLICHNRNTLF